MLNVCWTGCWKLGREAEAGGVLGVPQGGDGDEAAQAGETSGRSDDNMATILKRFDTFLLESLPVVKYYDNLQPGLVIKVSSVPPPDDVYKEIYCAILGFRGEMADDPMCAALHHSDSCDRLSFA